MSRDLVAGTPAHSQAPMVAVPPVLADGIIALETACRRGQEPQQPSVALVDAAKAFLPLARAAAAPCAPEIMRSWLERLVKALPIAGVKDDPERVSNALRAVALACEDMPVECFTRATLKMVLQKCRFFPSGAELHGILDPVFSDLKARVGWIRMIAESVPAPAPAEQTAAEREEMRLKLAGLAAELAAKTSANRPSKTAPTARPLSPFQLALAEYRRGVEPCDMAPHMRAALQEFLSQQGSRR